MSSSARFLKIVQNTAWLSSDHLIRKLVALIVSVWVARYLGPEAFGQLSFSIALVGLFTVFVELGLNQIIARDLIKKPNENHLILGSAFIMKLVGGFFVSFAACGLVIFLRPDDQIIQWMVAIIGLSTVFLSMNVVDAWVMAYMKGKQIALAKTAAFAVMTGFKISFLLLELPLIYFAMTIMIERILLFGLLWATYKRNTEILKSWAFDFQTAKGMLFQSWPLMLASGATVMQGMIDQVMLGVMVSDFKVGQYAVAYMLVAACVFLPGFLTQSFFPGLTKSYNDNPEGCYKQMAHIYRLYLVLAITGIVALFLLAPIIVSILYGSEYHYAGFLLQLLSFRLFFSFLGPIRGVYITQNNLFFYSMVTMVIGTGLNIAMNYFLIPIYGAVGAIIASHTSFFVSLILCDLISGKMKDHNKILMGIFDIKAYSESIFWFKGQTR